MTEQAAAEFVRRHGRGALTILGERAEVAAELGHRVAAKTWREMADAVARLLRSKTSDVDLTRSAVPQPASRRAPTMSVYDMRPVASKPGPSSSREAGGATGEAMRLDSRGRHPL